MIRVDPYEVRRALLVEAEDLLHGSGAPVEQVVAEAATLIGQACRLLESRIPEERHSIVDAAQVARAAVALAAAAWVDPEMLLVS